MASANIQTSYIILTTYIYVIGVQHVAGDMLAEVPKGDAIFMKVSIYFACMCMNYQGL